MKNNYKGKHLFGAQSCPALCSPRDYIACQVPLSMEFSRQEYWSEVSFPSPGDLLDPGNVCQPRECVSDSLLLVPPGKSIWVNIEDYLFSLISLSGNCSKWNGNCIVGFIKYAIFLKYDITSTKNKRGQMDLFCHKGLAFHVKWYNTI